MNGGPERSGFPQGKENRTVGLSLRVFADITLEKHVLLTRFSYVIIPETRHTDGHEAAENAVCFSFCNQGEERKRLILS